MLIEMRSGGYNWSHVLPRTCKKLHIDKSKFLQLTTAVISQLVVKSLNSCLYRWRLRFGMSLCFYPRQAAIPKVKIQFQAIIFQLWLTSVDKKEGKKRFIRLQRIRKARRTTDMQSIGIPVLSIKY